MNIIGPPTGELVPQGTLLDPKLLKQAYAQVSGPTGLASDDASGFATHMNAVLLGLKRAAATQPVKQSSFMDDRGSA